MYSQHKSYLDGFTLIELLVAIVVLGVLLGIALPSYQTTVKNNCLTTNTNTMVTSFQQARSEAVKRKTRIRITAANSGDNTNEWGKGWNVTIDEDANSNGVLDTNEDFDGDGVLDGAALFRTVTLSCDTTTIDGADGVTFYQYGSDGFIDKAGTFDVCDDRTGEQGRQVTINAVGRPNTNSAYGGCG